jgi:hypothetical protein
LKPSSACEYSRRRKIRAVAAGAPTARILGTDVGAPLLAVDRVTLTYGERPVESAAACASPPPYINGVLTTRFKSVWMARSRVVT